MTNEDMERAIEFLLKNQANFEVRLEQTIEQVTKTNRQVEQLSTQMGVLAETQNEFMQVVLQHIVAQGEINASLRDSMRSLNTAMERHSIEGHNGKA